MSTMKQVKETAENQPGVGRITPLNMRSEAGELNYDSMIRDMEAGKGDYQKVLDCEQVPWA